MLEPIRQYGREHLDASGQNREIRARHRDYYLQLVEQGEADLFSPRQVNWFNRLERELPNLRLALEFALTQPDQAHTALRMAPALRILWTNSGRSLEGHRWLTLVLESDLEPSVARARALSLYGHETALFGRLDEALAIAAEGRAWGERLHDPVAVAVADQASGTALLFQSQYDSALARLEQAMLGYRTAGTLYYLPNTLFTITVATALAGDPRAARYGAEAVAISEAHGAQWSQAWALITLSLHHWQQGQPEQAITLLRQALRLRGLDHEVSFETWSVGLALEILAWAMTATGQPETAATLFG